MNNRKRRGAISVLTAVMLVVMMAFMAFSIDLGYLHVTRSQLQRAADAGAMAAAWQLVDEEALTGGDEGTAAAAREAAEEFVANNEVLGDAPALGEEDVEVGYLTDFSDATQAIQTNGLYASNAVRVTVRRDEEQNDAVPLFFARVLGLDSTALHAEATAAIITSIGGFQAPSDGGNLGILPFALDQTTWNAMIAGGGTDNWTWNEANETITAGADGIREVNLYPQGTGSPGNRGTVDIGSSNNSTADIARQIVDGVSPDDLEYHDGELKFDSNGELALNGDTGISAGVKDELTSIKGEPRVIPIFTQVVGPGNNANYTIVKFVGIRILDVKLTGSMSSKRLTVQPANVVLRGAIPAPTAQTSQFVYSPVWLVR